MTDSQQRCVKAREHIHNAQNELLEAAHTSVMEEQFEVAKTYEAVARLLSEASGLLIMLPRLRDEGVAQ